MRMPWAAYHAIRSGATAAISRSCAPRRRPPAPPRPRARRRERVDARRVAPPGSIVHASGCSQGLWLVAGCVSRQPQLVTATPCEQPLRQLQLGAACAPILMRALAPLRSSAPRYSDGNASINTSWATSSAVFHVNMAVRSSRRSHTRVKVERVTTRSRRRLLQSLPEVCVRRASPQAEREYWTSELDVFGSCAPRGCRCEYDYQRPLTAVQCTRVLLVAGSEACAHRGGKGVTMVRISRPKDVRDGTLVP